jgi:hypothetical protein
MAVNIEQILNSLSTDSNSNIKHQQEIYYHFKSKSNLITTLLYIQPISWLIK